MADPLLVTVPAERLSRLSQALKQASEGEFTEAIELLRDSSQGELGEVERDVRVFIADFKLMIQQSELATEEFEISKRELFQKIDTIEEQRAAILELSAPIIDVWEGVVTVPLVGAMDSARVDELTERLLTAIHRTRSVWVLLDLTGAGKLGEAGGQSIIKLARAIRLMGAECLLTGISGEVARGLVSSEIALEGIKTIATLRAGLRHCLSQDASRAPTPRG
jgi:rsbT co-antagonist protein RsbR